MRPSRAALVAVAAALALALPGCLDPFRIAVDEGALARSGLAWERTERAVRSGGLWGPNTVETDYRFAGSANGPYPALLQLFGVRESSRRPTPDLLDLARSSVDNATAANHIRVEAGESSGTRTLRNGLATTWFALEGTVASAGLFASQSRVRILGEVGYDGLSSTHVLAVAIAQVDAQQCLLGQCQSRADERGWVAIAGDTEGSIGGAVSANGLVDNLVSHG